MACLLIAGLLVGLQAVHRRGGWQAGYLQHDRQRAQTLCDDLITAFPKLPIPCERRAATPPAIILHDLFALDPFHL